MDGWREGGAGLKPGGSRSDFSRITYNEFLFTMNMNMKKTEDKYFIKISATFDTLRYSPYDAFGGVSSVMGSDVRAFCSESLLLIYRSP